MADPSESITRLNISNRAYERRAAALRANLLRRKAQSRSRIEQDTEAEPPSPSVSEETERKPLSAQPAPTESNLNG